MPYAVVCVSINSQEEILPALDKNYADNKHAMKEFGSLFDGFAGVISNVSKALEKSESSLVMKDTYFGYDHAVSLS